MGSGFFRKFLILKCCIEIAFGTQAYASVRYIVKAGDTLSTISARNFKKKLVWGPSGTVYSLAHLNPQIKDINLIFPGTEILVEKNADDPADEPLEKTAATTPEAPTPLSPVLSPVTALNTSIPFGPPPAPIVSSVACVPTPSTGTESPKPASVTDGNANPSVETHAEKNLDDGTSTALQFTPFIAMARITSSDIATGSKSSIGTNLYGGVSGKFLQTWSERFESNLHARLAYLTFEPPTDASKTLAEKTKFLTAFGVEGKTALSPRLHLGLSLDLSNDLFVRGITTNSVTVDSVLVPSAGVNLSYEAVRFKAFKLNVSGSYAAELPTSTDLYALKTGSAYSAMVGIVRRSKNSDGDDFEVNAGTVIRSQDTTAAHQTETRYEMGITFFFDEGHQ